MRRGLHSDQEVSRREPLGVEFVFNSPVQGGFGSFSQATQNKETIGRQVYETPTGFHRVCPPTLCWTP